MKDSKKVAKTGRQVRDRRDRDRDRDRDEDDGDDGDQDDEDQIEATHTFHTLRPNGAKLYHDILVAVDKDGHINNADTGVRIGQLGEEAFEKEFPKYTLEPLPPSQKKDIRGQGMNNPPTHTLNYDYERSDGSFVRMTTSIYLKEGKTYSSRGEYIRELSSFKNPVVIPTTNYVFVSPDGKQRVKVHLVRRYSVIQTNYKRRFGYGRDLGSYYSLSFKTKFKGWTAEPEFPPLPPKVETKHDDLKPMTHKMEYDGEEGFRTVLFIILKKPDLVYLWGKPPRYWGKLEKFKNYKLTPLGEGVIPTPRLDMGMMDRVPVR